MAFLGYPEFDVEFSDIDFAKFAESFAKVQPYANRIGLSLFRNQSNNSSKGTIE